MSLCIPFTFSFKRRARSSDSDNDSAAANWGSATYSSTSTSSSNSSSSLVHLSPYDFASSFPSSHSRSPAISARADLAHNASATTNNNKPSIAVGEDRTSAGSISSHQVSDDSLDLIEFSSVTPCAIQQPTTFDSRDLSAALVHGDNKSIFTNNSGYDASHDTNSVASERSYASAVHGSVSEASLVSTEKIPIHTLRMQTSNSAAEHFRLRLALLAVLRGRSTNVHDDAVQRCAIQQNKEAPQPPIPAAVNLPSSAINSQSFPNVGMKDDVARTSTHEANLQPIHHSPNILPELCVSESRNPTDRVAAVNESSKPQACCWSVKRF